MQKLQQKFGKHLLNDFYIDKSYINTNHGSYGYTPKIVMQHKKKLQEQMEFNGEKWFRIDMEKGFNQTRSFVAQKVNTYQQNIFLVQNATDAFNGIMKSMSWNQGDVVLLPNTAYASIRKTLEWIRDKFKIQILQLNFNTEDFKSRQILQMKIQDAVNSCTKKIRCAVFDHISSVPAIIFPIQIISQFLTSKGIELFVDGAHAISQVDIDLQRIKCGAYFSNFHKWSFCPKNAAFLYLSNENLKIVRPAITGNFRGQGIDREYFWTGTRDCTSYLTVPKGFQYFESFGFNQVHNYNHNLVILGAVTMANIWKTTLLTDDTRMIGYITNVQLPTNDEQKCQLIQNQLMQKHNTYLVMYKFDNKMFCRICAQIYNDITDYQKTATIFLKLLEGQNKIK